MFTLLPLSVDSPVLSMVTTAGVSWEVVSTYFTCGTSTLMPYSMTCAVSMKITSNTRTTSTKGVTLISERVVPPPRRRERDPNPPPFTDIPIELLSETTFHHVQELKCEIVHAGTDIANLPAKNIV